MPLRLALLLLALLLALAPEAAAQAPIPPAPRDLPVLDAAGVLSPSEREALGRKLVAFDDTTGAQLAIVVLPTVDGADMNETATAIGRAWGVGDAEQDNGVVLLVALNDREMYIATGLGSEGPLPDVLAGRIIRDVIAPRFREGRFYAGLDAGADAILAALRGEYTAADRAPRPVASGDGLGAALSLVFFLLVLFLVLSILSRGRPGPPSSGGGRRRGRSRGPGVIIFPGSFGGSGGGGFGGGFGGGGFGGGGFGGFGGGGFGGGGAGGGW
jgi:uncharacterized protein